MSRFTSTALAALAGFIASCSGLASTTGHEAMSWNAFALAVFVALLGVFG